MIYDNLIFLWNHDKIYTLLEHKLRHILRDLMIWCFDYLKCTFDLSSNFGVYHRASFNDLILWLFENSYGTWDNKASPLFGSAFAPAVRKNLIFFLKTGGLVFLDHFDVLMSKIIFKKWKNIILMYFGTKNTLKSYRNRTPKRALKHSRGIEKLGLWFHSWPWLKMSSGNVF